MAAQINPESVPLPAIQERLGVGRTRVGEMRAEALTLIAEGYQSQAARDAAHEPQY